MPVPPLPTPSKPENDVAVTLPPEMVASVMTARAMCVPSRLSMCCERAMLLVTPPLAGRELGTLVSDAESEKIWLDSLLSS